jgi:hypothetical protein
MTGVVVTATDGAEHRRTKMAIFITHHHAARLLQLPQVAIQPNFEQFSLRDGIIRYKKRVWIGNNAKMHAKITPALHDSAIGGHSGFYATYHRIKNLFAWPGMKTFVQNWVRSCTICQQAKSE